MQVTGELSRIESLIDDGNITAEQGIVSAITEMELLADSTALVHTGTTFSNLAYTLAKAATGVRLPQVNLRKTSMPLYSEKVGQEYNGMPVFRSLVAPVPLGTFFQEYYGKKVLHSKHRTSKFDTDAIYEQIVEAFSSSTEELSEAAKKKLYLRSMYSPIRNALVNPDITSVRITNKGGKSDTVSPFIGSEVQAHELLASGKSIIINSFHNLMNRQKAIDAIVEEFIMWDLPGININAYIGGPGNNALPPHSDSTDTIILNVRGSKSWRMCVPEMGEKDAAELEMALPKLRRNAGSAELDFIFSDADRARLADVRQDQAHGCGNYDVDTFGRMQSCQVVKMEANDVLYIPKGIVHHVTTTEDMSVHLTMSMNRERETWYELLDEMIPRWSEQESRSQACKELARSTFDHLIKRSVFGALLHRSFPWSSSTENKEDGDRNDDWHAAYSAVLQIYGAQLQARWQPETAQCSAELMAFLRDETAIREGGFSKSKFDELRNNQFLDAMDPHGRKLGEDSHSDSCNESCDSDCNDTCNGGCNHSCDKCCRYNSSCDSECDESCNAGCDGDCDTHCDACGAGHYGGTHERCSACTAGYYCTGSTWDPQQYTCPGGKYSHAGWGSCGNCNAGRYGTGWPSLPETGAVCSGACGAGRYGNAGQSAIACSGACGAGRYGNAGQTAVACSGACKVGRYGLGGHTDSNCHSHCPVGYFQDQLGSSSCKICPGGYYQNQVSRLQVQSLAQVHRITDFCLVPFYRMNKPRAKHAVQGNT
jgi:hypothetical protein